MKAEMNRSASVVCYVAGACLGTLSRSRQANPTWRYPVTYDDTPDNSKANYNFLYVQSSQLVLLLSYQFETLFDQCPQDCVGLDTEKPGF